MHAGNYQVSQNSTCLCYVMNFTVFYCNIFSLDYFWACLMACMLSLERNREDWRDIYTKSLQIFSVFVYLPSGVFLLQG